MKTMRKTKKQPSKPLIEVAGEVISRIKKNDPETYEALKQVRKQVFLVKNRD